MCQGISELHYVTMLWQKAINPIFLDYVNIYMAFFSTESWLRLLKNKCTYKNP